MNAFRPRLQHEEGVSERASDSEDEARQMTLFEAAGRARGGVSGTHGPASEERARPLPPTAPAEPHDAPPPADLASPEATLGERIVRAAYRMGVPAGILDAPFRRPEPLRITATVECPALGDRVAGMALRAGHFLVGGARIPLARADFSAAAHHAPLVEQALHGFGWLDDLAACAPASQCEELAERVLRSFLAANPEPDPPAHAGPWHVETAARRLLACLVNAPLILAGGDKAYRAATLEAIDETARWLERHAGKAADRHGAAFAFAALAAAGLLLPHGRPRRLLAETALAEALAGVIGEDGGVLSRSPLAQTELLVALIRLAACYRATRAGPPPCVASAVALLVPPLVGMADAGGAIGSWQGGGRIDGERMARLIAASGVRPRPPREVRGWGYQRLEGAGSVLVCDAAPPPLAAHARFGCASTLAFEFSHQGQPVIVNCGGAALTGGLTPARIEQALRASAAHSTLVLDDANSTATVLGGKLGKGVQAVELDRAPGHLDDGRPATRLEAAHDGYVARFGLTHRRILQLAADGTALAGEDRLEPAGRRGRRGKVGYALRFHLGPLVDLRLGEGAHEAELLLPDGTCWRLRSAGEPLIAEESLWVDGEGRPHETQQLVIEGLASRAGEAFAWQLDRIG